MDRWTKEEEVCRKVIGRALECVFLCVPVSPWPAVRVLYCSKELSVKITKAYSFMHNVVVSMHNDRDSLKTEQTY